MPKDRIFEELWLCVTSRCNAKCKYCWWQRFGQHAAGVDMTQETADKAIDFIDINVIEGGKIALFGGEPLLNFPTIQYIMNKKPWWDFKIFTNATRLDDNILDYFYERRDFIEIVLSLDGTDEVQFRNRGVRPDYEKVKSVFRRFKNSSVSLTIEDPSVLYDGIKFLHSLGATMVKANRPEFVEFDDIYIKTLEEQVNKIYNDKELASVMPKPVDNTTIKEFCKCGENKFSILPNGDIYPCDVFSCFKMNKIGSVYSGIDQSARDPFLAKKKEDQKSIKSSCYINHLYLNKRI